MMRKFITLSLILVTTLSIVNSCSSESSGIQEDLANGISKNPWHISAEKAVEIANKNRVALFKIGTRTNTQIKVECFKTPATRGAPPEDAFYIINYGEDEGFAVVSADARLDVIQAISDTGSLSMADTISNKGLSMFFNQLYSLYTSPTPAGPTIPDTVMQLEPEILNKKETLGPLLHLNVRYWHQRQPFNYQCPIVNTAVLTRSVTGCTALSMGQIMSFKEWPTSINGRTLNWEEIKNNDYEQIAYLLATLGSPQYLNLDYHEEYASGLEENIIPAFLAAGYTSVSKRDSFIPSTAYHDIKQYGPIMVNGISNFDAGERHAWVLDGYIYTENSIIGEEGQPRIEYGYLFHCVWGAAGRGDGFYRWQGNAFADNPEIKVEGDSYNIGYHGSDIRYWYKFQH